MKIRSLILILITALALTACNFDRSSDDTDTDVEAAQSFFPALQSYNASSTDNIRDAVVTALGGASLLTANPVQAGLIAQADSMIDCYQEVGAADAQVYTQRINISEPTIPIAGVLAVVNQNRVADNFLHCLTSTPLDGVFGAQSVQPQPCYGYGTFTFNEDRISFLYAATDQPLCNEFNTYFAQYNPSGDTGAIQIPSR